MGRPKIEIDKDEVLKLAQLGCKNEEIADWFGVSTDTIERRFAGELTKGKTMLRMSLRRWQLDAAKRGNIAMMIWLGKQMLGQIERSLIDITKVPDDQFIAETQRRLSDGSKKPKDS